MWLWQECRKTKHSRSTIHLSPQILRAKFLPSNAAKIVTNKPRQKKWFSSFHFITSRLCGSVGNLVDIIKIVDYWPGNRPRSETFVQVQLKWRGKPLYRVSSTIELDDPFISAWSPTKSRFTESSLAVVVNFARTSDVAICKPLQVDYDFVAVQK